MSFLTFFNSLLLLTSQPDANCHYEVLSRVKGPGNVWAVDRLRLCEPNALITTADEEIFIVRSPNERNAEILVRFESVRAKIDWVGNNVIIHLFPETRAQIAKRSAGIYRVVIKRDAKN